ncbi:DUF6412 domain-containing protein [Actinophytocola sediminis]
MDVVGTRMRVAVALVLPALLLALPAAGDAGPLSLAGALTAGLAAALGVFAMRPRIEPASTPATVRTVSLRERARLTTVVRLRDPDAPGRIRSRAPSPGSAAA